MHLHVCTFLQCHIKGDDTNRRARNYSIFSFISHDMCIDELLPLLLLQYDNVKAIVTKIDSSV